MVIAGFLRLVTNPRVFVEPMPITSALAFIDALLKSPGVEIPTSGQEWPTLRELCAAQELTGNDVPDAWIAATVNTLHGHLVTFDGGFARLLSRRELTVLSPRPQRAS